MKSEKYIVLVVILLLGFRAQAQTYDSDAQKFFTATGITNTTQKNAVDQLVPMYFIKITNFQN